MKKLVFLLCLLLLLSTPSLASMLIQAVVDSNDILDNVVDVWNLDNDATAVNDSSHDLSTAAGTPAYGSTNPPQGTHYLTLDNTAYLSLADDPDFDVGENDYSISVWVYFDSDADDGIIGKCITGSGEGGWSLYTDYITDDRYLAIRHVDGFAFTAVSSTWAVSTGAWYHIAMAYDHDSENEITFWVSSRSGTFGDQLNGESLNQDRTPAANSQPLYVGFDDLTDAIMDGNIDEPVFFNKAITAAEAEDLYDGSWR